MNTRVTLLVLVMCGGLNMAYADIAAPNSKSSTPATSPTSPATSDATKSERAEKNQLAKAVDQDCSAEAQVAGCGSEKVGHGLVHCLWTYKNSHKEAKYSSACMSALHALDHAK